MTSRICSDWLLFGLSKFYQTIQTIKCFSRETAILQDMIVVKDGDKLCTVGAKEMFTLLKQQKIFLAKQGIKFHISLSLLSVGGV